MRPIFAFVIGFLLTACAADMPVEDTGVDSTYASPVAVDSPTEAAPAPTDGPAPTPYGMVIEPPQPGDSGSKGTSPAPALAAQKLLTGRWVNTADEEETVEFTPTHYKTYYQNELLVEEDMTFYGQCPAACSGGTPTGEPCFTISGPAQTDCYGIVQLTGSVLELQLLGISTETVVYRRAD